MGNLHVNFTIVYFINILPPTLLPYFIPFLNSYIFAFAILCQIAIILPIKVIHLHI